MAFKITQRPTFKALVEVYTPNDKCGHDLSKFTAVFKRIDTDELDKLRKLPAKDVMRAVLVGWEDFNDQDNNPVPYNEEMLEVLIKVPEALVGLGVAFWNNIIKAREGN